MKRGAYFESPIQRLHDTSLTEHVERPDRLSQIMPTLKATGLYRHLEQMSVAEGEPWDALQKVHAARYLRKVLRAAGTAPKSAELSLDVDTYIRRESPDVIAQAIKGIAQSVEYVIDEQSFAFCATRPPGHHAGKDFWGGFCITNQAAYAAEHARTARGVEKVLIVDWDAHYGNGTQNIYSRDPDTFYFSMHAANTFPRGGNATNRGKSPAKGITMNVPLTNPAPGVYTALFAENLHTISETFKPELIVVSAGFDGHKDDPMQLMQLEDATYGELTANITDTFPHIPLVSVLEGGYDPVAVARSVATHIGALIESQ